MGRKQKLRQERKIRNKAAAAAVVTTTSAEATVVEATSEGILSEEAAIAAPLAAAAKATSEGILSSRSATTKQNKTTLQQGRKMSESPASQGRAKRIKLEGSDSVGSPPKEFSDDNVIAKIKYHIPNFANREGKKDEQICTGAINAYGHVWELLIFPWGHSSTDAEYVTLGLYYAGENTKTDPVVAKAMIHTKTTSELLDKDEYDNEDEEYCDLINFSKREDIIKNDCDDAGALTITIELQVATNKSPTAAVVTTTSEATVEATVEATSEGMLLEEDMARLARMKEIDSVFPKSDEYVQATDTHIINGNERYALLINDDERYALVKQGAIEHGCVHSISFMGEQSTKGNRMNHHLCQPWLLEGAIRGSYQCIINLIERYVYQNESSDESADALYGYWWEISLNIEPEPCNDFLNELKDDLEQQCESCSKTNTETTLKECIGCKWYCYCSVTCQTTHWNEYNHRGECKQFHILNKYHKPYAKAIRDAAIRGDMHPALDKLRYKLGLSRPLQEYEELMQHNTHDGKAIDPKDYVVAREDGKVWVGSFPSSPEHLK